MNRDAVAAALTCILAGVAAPAFAQPLSGPASSPRFRFSTAMPPGVASPDQVETRLGTLNFFDGFPDKASAAKFLDPPNVPVKDFRSVILHANRTRSMIQIDQEAPSVSSQTKGVLVNADGSVDVYFEPQP